MAVPSVTGIPLADGQERIAILPASYGVEDLNQVLELFDTVVLMKMGTEIPTVVDYPSLNVSQAVVIYVYEIYRAYMRSCELAPFSNGVVRAPKAEYQRLFERAIRVMNSLGMTEGFSDKFSKSFNRLLGRADWSIKDIATFDALLKHTENYIERQSSRE